MAAKIGEGVLAAYGRQGLAELRAAVSFHSPIEQPTDYGMLGVATPGEVAQDRSGKEVEGDKHSTLESRMPIGGEPRDHRDDRGRDGPEMDR